MLAETGVSFQMAERLAPVDFRSSLATLKERVGARVFDALAVGVLTLLATIALADLPRNLIGLRLLVVTGVVVSATYETILVGTLGQTFGKRIMGIMIVTYPSGGAVSYRSAAVRFVILAVVPLGLLAFARARSDPFRRGLHDKAGRTVVVRSEAKRAGLVDHRDMTFSVAHVEHRSDSPASRA